MRGDGLRLIIGVVELVAWSSSRVRHACGSAHGMPTPLECHHASEADGTAGLCAVPIGSAMSTTFISCNEHFEGCVLCLEVIEPGEE